MFEQDFADKAGWSQQASSVGSWQTSLQRSTINRIQALYWREHCLECAPPECYHSCPLYVSRQDRRCARFEYGIYPNRSLNGLLPYGAEIKFRKWGKLGTILYESALSPASHNVFSWCDKAGMAIVSLAYRWIRPVNPIDLLKIRSYNPQRLGYKAYAVFRDKMLRTLPVSSGNKGGYDAFVLECFSFESDPFNFLLEYKDSVVRSRHAIEIKPGHNYRQILMGEFNGTGNPLRGTLNLYPENDREARVAFTWLDFVQKKPSVKTVIEEGGVPAEKVKCVVWDLDNTVWKGILIEDGRKHLVLREEVVRLIHALDERGIIQSVVSKNDEAEAMETLAEFGLKDYFVSPVINWEPKSVNLRRLAAALNINVDTLALIDDSPFERAEVKSGLSQCRVYNEQEVSMILSYPEFNVSVTEESRMRRKSYMAEIERQKAFNDQGGGDYEQFLRSCRMEMRIFIPRQEAQVVRCLELIQRSNQLNLSTKRYSEAEFNELFGTENMLCVGLHCKDKFGDYGIVGFASVDESSSEPRLMDLVISCRVAQKMVERTLIEWLAERAKAKGYRVLIAELAKTRKNGPLRAVFESLPFSIAEETDRVIKMKLPLQNISGRNGIVQTVIDL